MINKIFIELTKECIKEELKKRNINVDSKRNVNSIKINFDAEDIKDIIKKYLSLKKQYFIVNKKMNVEYSREFQKKKSSFTKNQKIILSQIEDRFKENKSIKPYLSNNLYLGKFSKEDILKKEYNIYHLHLNTPDKKECFVKRTDKLLFFTYVKDSVIFLDVRRHPVGCEWEEIEAIEIRSKYLDDNQITTCNKTIDDEMFGTYGVINRNLKSIFKRFENELEDIDCLKELKELKDLKDSKYIKEIKNEIKKVL